MSLQRARRITTTGLVLAAAVLVLLVAPARAGGIFSRELAPVAEGNQLYQEQRYEEALEKYEEAEQDLSQEPRIHRNRGAALFQQGRFKEAREAYLRASGVEDPQQKKENYYNIGNTYLSEGALREAMAYYKKALKIDPGWDEARFNLELCIQAKQQQEDQQKDKQQDSQGDKQEQPSDQPEKDPQQDQDQDAQDQKQEDSKAQDSPNSQDPQEQQQEKPQPGEQPQEQPPGGQDQQEQQAGQQPGEQDAEQDQLPQPGSQSDSGQEQTAEQQDAALSPAQVEDLLDAMQENERPFQMHRFVLPQFKRKTVERDW